MKYIIAVRVHLLAGIIDWLKLFAGISDYGEDPQYGYDPVPQLYVSTVSCTLTDGELSIELRNIGLANRSSYHIAVLADIVCFVPQTNTSYNPCGDCIGVSSNIDAQSSYNVCKDCVNKQAVSFTAYIVNGPMHNYIVFMLIS